MWRHNADRPRLRCHVCVSGTDAQHTFHWTAAFVPVRVGIRAGSCTHACMRGSGVRSYGCLLKPGMCMLWQAKDAGVKHFSLVTSAGTRDLAVRTGDACARVCTRVREVPSVLATSCASCSCIVAPYVHADSTLLQSVDAWYPHCNHVMRRNCRCLSYIGSPPAVQLHSTSHGLLST